MSLLIALIGIVIVLAIVLIVSRFHTVKVNQQSEAIGTNKKRTKVRAKISGISQICYREERTDGTYSYYSESGQCLDYYTADGIIITEILDEISEPSIPDCSCSCFSDPFSCSTTESNVANDSDSYSDSYSDYSDDSSSSFD